ncbi:MAG: hypothetical protein IPN76_01470 [Saprospiraceae bacterium]|nr:hypothetical protein [Saprospiraceae bacterium]
MKKLIYSILAMATFTLVACGSDHQHKNSASGSEAKAHGTTKEYTSAYVCPMHCEGSGSDQPGKCPVCEMDYVALSEHLNDGHNH